MDFTIVGKNGVANIYLASNEYAGVKRAAGWLAEDVFKVTGKKPEIVEAGCLKCVGENMAVIAGTVGMGGLVEKAAEKIGFDLSQIAGKREVFAVAAKDNLLLVAGSDKRAVIYGILSISEAIGVTPMIYFGDISPKTYDEIYVDAGLSKACEKDGALYINPSVVSKEPSVRYRGFFINDEWPAFGNWSESHFGDENKECYEKIFEYLLRLKGNYMWPAMWASVLWSDGPGLATAELADELGVVLGTSHHEPCIRAGEEFIRLNPVHTEYGKNWSFVTNREGVTKFWEDSLAEREKFENIITVGMRGERDSKLFEDAKLIDNINVLKDVIDCQKGLIEKYAPKKEDGSAEMPPMMLAIYKEVEDYYKGDAKTEGLKEWDGLDGVTLMLCDDNFGNLRLMPDDDKRDHKGGYGMYYHFDYHGGPVSYEWINSSYLPKIWEQMTTCYDYGIREIWIVNCGDLKNQELPLNYFMDLAYDFDKYGTSKPGNYRDYLTDWINAQFNGLSDDKLAVLRELAEGYTRLNNIVKPEVMNASIYSLERFSEADRVLSIVSGLEKKAEDLYKALETVDGGKYLNQYVSLLYYQAMESFNLVKMWIYSAKNQKYAAQGRVSANYYADRVRECLKQDKALVELFHSFDDGRWYGMGLSRHIGFNNWNDEGARKPKMTYIEPQARAELILADADSNAWSVGGPWCKKPVRLSGFDYKCFGAFEICSAGDEPISYEISSLDADIEFLADSAEVERLCRNEESYNKCMLKGLEDELKLNWAAGASGATEADVRIYVRLKKGADISKRHEFTVKTNNGDVSVFFGKEIIKTAGSFRPAVIIPAEKYAKLSEGRDGRFQLIPEFGKLLPGENAAALKAYPQDIVFEDGPVAEYKLEAEESGRYLITVKTAPSNPAFEGSRISAELAVNDGEFTSVETIPEGFNGGDTGCRDWCIGVLVNMRTVTMLTELEKGENSIKIRAVDPGFVVEQIIVEKE